MNTLEKITIRSPSLEEEECAKIIIDDPDTPFVLHDIAQKGQQYTLSFYIMAETVGSIDVDGMELETGVDWIRHVLTFTASDVNIAISFHATGTYYIYHPQLEIGCKATDFVEAPEDTEEDILSISYRTSELEVGVEGIAARVSATESIAAEVQSGLEGVEADMTQISSKVSELEIDLEGITTRVSATETTIAENGNRLGIAEGDILSISTRTTEVETTVDGITSRVSTVETTLDGTENRLSTVETLAEQTADKFSWLVVGGESATEFTLTDRMATLVADTISLNGNVKVSGEMLVDESVTADKMNVSTLSAITADLGSVMAGSIDIGDGKFVVTSTGELTATGATINGTVTSSYGTGTILLSGNLIDITDTSEDDSNQSTGINLKGTFGDAWVTNSGITIGPHGGNVAPDVVNAQASGSVASLHTIYTNVATSPVSVAGALSLGYSSGTTVANTINMRGDTGHVTANKHISTNKSSSWISVLQGYAGLDVYEAGNSSGVNGLARVKCANGAWAIGAYNLNNSLYIVYGDETRLTAGTNGTDASFRLDPSGNLSVPSLTVSGEAAISSFAFSGSTITNANGLVFSNGIYTCGLVGTESIFRVMMADDGNVELGASSARWKKVYASSSSISTSDERDKKIIGGLDERHKRLFMRLKPITFRWNDENIDTKIHFGLGAQTTEQSALECGILSEEIAAIEHSYWDKPSPRDGRTDRYGMAYEEIAMLSIPVVQEHERMLATHEEKIASLEMQLESVRYQLEQAYDRIAQLEKQMTS